MKKAKVITYKNGLRLVVNPLKNYQSVSLIVKYMVGSKDEDESTRGISHFIEHLMFKGTKNRTAKQLAEDFNELGGSHNAFTSNSSTKYYIKTTNENIDKGCELLSDMVLNSLFTKEAVEKEKGVIIQEILRKQDNPKNLAFEKADSLFYKDTVFEGTILGSVKDIKNKTQTQILDYYNKHYVPENLIVSVAGDITVKEAKKLVDKYFNSVYVGEAKPNLVEQKQVMLKPKSDLITVKKDTEQSHIVLYFPVCNLYNDEKYSVGVLTAIFGEGMNSRLFTEVREKKGLVYTVFGSHYHSDIAGELYIYFATDVKNVAEAIVTIKKEINKILKNGFTEQEVKKDIKNIKTSLKLEAEGTYSRANSNAYDIQFFNHIRLIKDSIAKYNSITTQDVNATFKKYLSSADNCVMAYVGKELGYDPLKLFKGEIKLEDVTRTIPKNTTKKPQKTK